MMLATEVWDVSPSSTAVGSLHEHGVDPWVVDFGAPEREEGGLTRTLTDHVLAVSDAVDRVREATGRDIHLVGYSQGGMFCYQAAAYRRSDALFRQDADGDYWLVDEVSGLMRTTYGVVPSVPIEDTLGDMDAVDLVVAYGVPAQASEDELAVAAVTLR